MAKISGNKFIAIFLWLAFCLFPFFVYANDNQAVEIVVQESDTLISICGKYLEYPGKWKEVAKFNHLKNPDLIHPGQVMRIPLSLLKGEPAEGVASFVKGRVEFQSEEGKEWKPLFFNDRIKEGSRIRTGDESAVEIMFGDGNSFLQSQNTTLGLSTARKAGVNHAIYKLFLKAGRTITKIQSVTGRESRFEIDTPSSICAARGTVFRTSVDASDSTRSEVLNGIVDVEAMKEKVKVKEGEGTLVKTGSPPMKPRKLLPPPEIVNVFPVYKNIPLQFEFGMVEGAVSYRAMLAKDGDFKDILRERIIKPGDPFKIFEVDDGTYFLQVLSIDDLGLEGLPSETSVIRVRMNPMPPVIQSPVDKAVYREKSLVCKWLRVNDAVRYHVQIAEDKEFKKIIEDRDDIKGLQYETADLDYETYYFRIGSIANDDYHSGWSDILSFTLAPPADLKK